MGLVPLNDKLEEQISKANPGQLPMYFVRAAPNWCFALTAGGYLTPVRDRSGGTSSQALDSSISRRLFAFLVALERFFEEFLALAGGEGNRFGLILDRCVLFALQK